MTTPNADSVALPMTFDGVIEHMIHGHGQHFMDSGSPPTDPDFALEYQLESHDALHRRGASHDHGPAQIDSSGTPS